MLADVSRETKVKDSLNWNVKSLGCGNVFTQASTRFLKQSKRALLCAIVWLNGCTHFTPLSVSTSQPNTFTVSGAIAVKNQHRGWAAHFSWEYQNPQAYHIVIYGPLGADTVDITQNAQGVIYREGHKTRHAQQAETLLAQETGVRLPVQYLGYWIRGNPAPGPITRIRRTNNHDVASLYQAGYHLEYSNYYQHRPYKILITGHQLQAKIIIKDWSDIR